MAEMDPEMDPAMASLTQSLEELDRDVEAEVQKKTGRPRLSLSNHTSPVIRKTGPGSVPLLASTEDISIAVATSSKKQSQSTKELKKSVNPESYSTVV